MRLCHGACGSLPPTRRWSWQPPRHRRTREFAALPTEGRCSHPEPTKEYEADGRELPSNDTPLWRHQRLTFLLEALKFAAILVGTVSGAVGTLTDTRDKDTGAPTVWGRRIVALIIAAGVIAIAIQGIESYRKFKSDQADDKRKVLADKQTAQILADASATAQGIAASRSVQVDTLTATKSSLRDLATLQTRAEELRNSLQKQDASLQQTVTGVQRTAANLTSVLEGQNVALENLYRLTHPLGDVRVELMVHYPIRDDEIAGLEARWLQRVRAATDKSWAIIEQASPLNPDPEDDRREYSLLRNPEFDLIFNNPPTQSGTDGAYLRDHGAQLLLRTTMPVTGIYIHFDEKRIDQQVKAPTVRLLDEQRIASWRDLYGTELIVTLPETAPTGTTLLSCNIFFGPGLGAGALFLPFNDTERRANPINQPFSRITYVKVLSEKELGPKPAVIK